jgi:hypothetical protein
MKINQKKVEAVIALPGPKRYEHFIKVIVDREEVWGLYLDGWALAGDDNGKELFPVWPMKEYAFLSAVKEWEGYVPRSFSLEYFVDDMLPKLKEDGVSIAVFYTPSDTGIVPEFGKLYEDIKDEMRKY